MSCRIDGAGTRNAMGTRRPRNGGIPSSGRPEESIVRPSAQELNASELTALIRRAVREWLPSARSN